jgi:ubiquinone/menaquinone biosynthesis C-methylase UbiE
MLAPASPDRAPAVPVADFSTVTEIPGTGITRQALDMLWTRYAYAAELCAGRDVLELACGTGQGLACLAARARRVVGCDYTYALVESARHEYGSEVPVMRADAQALPFGAATFDAVVLFEALYYLGAPERFVEECRRVLRPGGVAIVCSVNPQWTDFNPSPHSCRYLTAAEVSTLFTAQGFAVDTAAAFPAEATSAKASAVSVLKRTAVSLGLVPKTMKGKRLLKRLFLGELVNAPARLSAGVAAYHEPVAFDRAHPGRHKVFYVVARLR